MIWKTKKGFTLIELILVIGLISVVIALAFNMFKFGNVAQTMAITEYDIQSQMRVTAQKINTTVRYSSALFALPEITDPNSLKGWNYITMTNIDENGYGDEIVNYVYDGSNPAVPKWEKNIIVERKNNIKYKLNYKKYNPHDEDKLIEFYISVKDTKTGVERNITSELEAFNSLQIVDRGKPLGKKSTILCYRVDPRPLAAEAAISMVLDKSGSMEKDLNGKSDGESRIDILKAKANKMIDSFSEKSNISMNIVPFSTSANNPKTYKNDGSDGEAYTANAYDKFLNVSAHSNKVKDDIKNIKPKGGTNTGDGIRIAYHNLVKNYNANYDPEVNLKNYMIILVDGTSTFYSVEKNNSSKYLLDDTQVKYKYEEQYDWYGYLIGWSISGQVKGKGSGLDEEAEKYIEEIGKKVKGASNIGGIKVYVIGFSNIESDHENLNTIGEATGAFEFPDEKDPTKKNRFFKATSDEKLEEVFNIIKNDIETELWHVYGPR